MGIEVSALHAHIVELTAPGFSSPLWGAEIRVARVAAGLPSVAGVPSLVRNW
jgi:hypothetical protein